MISLSISDEMPSFLYRDADKVHKIFRRTYLVDSVGYDTVHVSVEEKFIPA
jgi:hypothetical protein